MFQCSLHIQDLTFDIFDHHSLFNMWLIIDKRCSNIVVESVGQTQCWYKQHNEFKALSSYGTFMGNELSTSHGKI